MRAEITGGSASAGPIFCAPVFPPLKVAPQDRSATICPPDGLEKEMTAPKFPETSFRVILERWPIRRLPHTSRHCDKSTRTSCRGSMDDVQGRAATKNPEVDIFAERRAPGGAICEVTGPKSSGRTSLRLHFWRDKRSRSGSALGSALRTPSTRSPRGDQA